MKINSDEEIVCCYVGNDCVLIYI